MDAFFANPAGLFAGLLALPVIALFMLKHRPVQRRVASTLLWHNVSQMQIADAPLSRLRSSASLLLNLAALACAVLALAGFRIPEGRERGLPVVIVIDRTAGMRANTPDGSRIELARETARRVITSAGDSTFTLIGWDGSLLPLAPRDCEADAALRSLAGLDASARGAPEGPLVDELRRMAEGHRRVVLISDHEPANLGKNVLWLSAGEAVDNAGIVAAGLTDIADGAELFFALEWHGPAERRASVVVERVSASGEAELVDARDVLLRPRDRVSMTVRVTAEGLYRGRLRDPDALAVDDAAYVRFSRRHALAVRVEGDTPKNLQRLFDALGLKPAEAADQNAAVVFTRATGASPRLPAAYIYPAAPAGVEFAPPRDESAITARPVAGFLWAGAGVPDIRLPRAAAILSTEFMQPVLDAGEGSVVALVSRPQGAISDLVVGFNFEKESGLFPESPAFVVFWANWFDHVQSIAEALPRGAVAAADAVSVLPLSGRDDFRYAPVGASGEGELRAAAPGETLDLYEPGVYRFEGLADARLPLIGVSLLDSEETNTARAPAEKALYADLQKRLSELGAGNVRADFEFAPWLALMALIALTSDWVLFRRRYRRQEPNAPVKPLPGGATVRRKQTGRV
ncbi:MAG: VWA domain-containing protein [Planctomycetes bacterium]|nr:VWA domain-containing protein [Planctomycetota bacterium]